jgi:hypothetical protein
MAKAKPPKTETRSLADAGYQQFVVEELHRSELKGAEYNPRIITDQEKSKLKKALARHGLVAPITWNRRTGNIVGGHQRIGIMDSLMRTDDYTLSVAVIDVEPTREKELNVLLNNTAAQGSWDMDALKNLFGDEKVTLEGSGFDIGDMYDMFGDTAINERAADLEEFATKLAALSDSYDKVSEHNAAKLDGEFYCVLVFPSRAKMLRLFKHLGVRDSRYQNGVFFAEKAGLDLGGED